MIEGLYVAGAVLACLFLLVLGAWCVSEGGEILGEKYDATVVGGFLLSWLNTAPEAIFFVSALNSNQPDFAVGAMSGSVIVVCTVAVGCCIVFGSLARKAGTIFLFPSVRKQAIFLAATLPLIVITIASGFNSFIGLVGILEYAAFIVYSLVAKPANGSEPKVEDVELGTPGDEDGEGEHEAPIWKGWGFLALGGAIIYAFSEPFIHNVVRAGQLLDMDPVVLAFFFAPLASEAPEIIESISLSRNGKTQNINIAFSNLVGGTISKTTLLFGILNLYSVARGFEWLHPAYTVSLLLIVLCAGATALLGSVFPQMSIRSGQALIAIFVTACISQYLTMAMSASDLLDHQLQDAHLAAKTA